MAYEVLATTDADYDYANIVDYLMNVLGNEQAVSHFMNEYDEAVELLSDIAGSLGPCQDEELADLGYHRLNFKEMNYFFLYRISGDKAIIEGIFHGSQDYENILK